MSLLGISPDAWSAAVGAVVGGSFALFAQITNDRNQAKTAKKTAEDQRLRVQSCSKTTSGTTRRRSPERDRAGLGRLLDQHPPDKSPAPFPHSAITSRHNADELQPA